VSVIDFDRGRLRAPGRWKRGNLQRLRRSLDKLSVVMPAGRFAAGDWDRLIAGYETS